MVVLEVFKKDVKIIYKSTLLSKATVLVFIFGILSVVVPFILAYKSRGFWLKRDTFHEQPDVRFKGEYIFTASTNKNRPISCGSLPYYEKSLENLDTCSFIKVYEGDDNFDGKVDEFSLDLKVNLPEGTHLTSICIVVPLDYKLHTVCPLQMQTVVIFQTFLPLSISSYLLVGDIVITQSNPLICDKRQNTVYNYSIIPNHLELESYKISNIINEHSKRNVSTVLKNLYTSFELTQAPYFHLNLKLKYPEDVIFYKPGFWQLVKWAWIQYLSIYIVVSWLVGRIKSYIFNRRLVLFYEDNPFKKKQ